MPGFKVGAWGVNARMKNTIGYVSTQRSQTTEEMNTDLDLNSSVEINFKTDYLPLNRLTTPGQASRIQEHSINPAAEQESARATRERRISETDRARTDSLNRMLTPSTPPAQSASPTRRASDSDSTSASHSDTHSGSTPPLRSATDSGSAAQRTSATPRPSATPTTPTSSATPPPSTAAHGDRAGSQDMTGTP